MFFKKICIYAIALLLVVPVVTPASAHALSLEQAHKAIVKIVTYVNDVDYQLIPFVTGSGVIISGDGLILTNNHVIDLVDNFDQPADVAYGICLTTSTGTEPDCSYTADLIAKDVNKDVALLKIRTIDGVSSRSSFEYLVRSKDPVEDGEIVKALGYPAIGGDTITASIDTVVGSTDKYSLRWIKTGAVIAFGSSGGALINLNGQLIGLTTQSHSDRTGSLGYAIHMDWLRAWIDFHEEQPTIRMELDSRLQSLIRKQDSLERSTHFTNSKPHIEVTRPDAWEFIHDSENTITIDNPEQNGGVVTIHWNPSSVLVDDTFIDFTADALTLMGTHYVLGDTMLAGKSGKKLLTSLEDEEFTQMLVSSDNYVITVTTHEGVDNKDAALVNQILDSLVITDTGAFAPSHSYVNTDPYFSIEAPAPWALRARDNVIEPVISSNQDVPELGFSVHVRELSDALIGISNENYFNLIRDNDVVMTDVTDLFGFDTDRYFLSTDYAFNGELTHGISYRYRFTDPYDNDAVKAFAAGYRIIKGDKAVIIALSFLGEDEQLFEQYRVVFERDVLQSLSFGGQITNPDFQADTDSTAEAVVVKGYTTDSNDSASETDIQVASTNDNVIEDILDEALDLFQNQFSTLRDNLGITINAGREELVNTTLLPQFTVGQDVSLEVENRIRQFIAYGSVTSDWLGMGERAGVVDSFRSAFDRLPETQADWEDVLKISSGRWPSQQNVEKENQAKQAFSEIYLREPEMNHPNDNAAVTIMTYGLRPTDRNMESEQAAILSFEAIYGKAPSSAIDWDKVRAIAYSGAVR